MRTLTVIAVTLTLSAACGSAPTDEIQQARAARDRASASAGQYAPEALKAAQEAHAALDTEIAVQDAKWFKSYDRARELAVAARVASERAVSEAEAGKARADAEAAAAAAKAKADAEMRATLAKTAVRVGGAIRAPRKVKDVPAVYPAIAKSTRVGGTVQLELTITPDGKVGDARVIRSVPLLDQAALDAAKQWEYAPTRVKGVAVPVIINVAMEFKPQG
ncbi:MAG: energy transducer TonB [Acidobacteria bacterium]|nr:energy transducer TonB [Acidobacteriota bacterium]